MTFLHLNGSLLLSVKHVSCLCAVVPDEGPTAEALTLCFFVDAAQLKHNTCRGTRVNGLCQNRLHLPE